MGEFDTVLYSKVVKSGSSVWFIFHTQVAEVVIVGVGFQVDKDREPIIPIISYTNDLNAVPYTPFIDYRTGKEYKENTQFYWKRLS